MRHHFRLGDYHVGFAARHPLWYIFDSVSLVSGNQTSFFSKTTKLTCLSVDQKCRFPSLHRRWCDFPLVASAAALRGFSTSCQGPMGKKRFFAAEMEPWVREWYSYNGIVEVNMFRVGSLEAGVMMRSFQDCQKCEVQDFECQVCFALWVLKERWDLVRV